MAKGRTVEGAARMLTAHYRTNPTSMELCLCDSSGWSSPPTEAEITASIIAETQGYTFQDVTPPADAVTNGTEAAITTADASISVTSGTLNYSGWCIRRDGTEIEGYQSHDTKTLDSAAGAHSFSGIRLVANV